MKLVAAVLATAAAAAGLFVMGASGQPSAVRVLKVTLAGESETPAGDPVATGSATFRIKPGTTKICYRLSVGDLSDRALAAHIHRGSAGTVGGIVVKLRTPNASGNANACAKASRRLVKAILAHPSRYYVNVHTAEFPGGAVRGQLAGARPTLGTILHLDLKGTTEPNASGTAVLRFRRDAQLICYRLRVANVTLPTTAAHIHKGAAGTNGPVVVGLAAPGANGVASGCAAATTAIIDAILADRAGYYVNVHTKEHPAGAIRAQLG